MILTYEFTYISTNGVLENFLADIAAHTEHYITKEGDKIFLHVRADEKELEEFSNTLSNSLPYSIFLKEVTAYASEDWESEKGAKKPDCEIFLPFTKLSYVQGKATQNPFIANEIGRNLELFPPLILETKGKKEKFDENFSEAFDKAADIIAQNESLNVKTPSGVFCLSKLQNMPYENCFFMPTDLSVTDKMAVLKANEISALASLEKPILRTHTNLIFASKYPEFARFIKIGLANDLFLQYLSNALFKKGVEFLAVADKECGVSNSLYFEGNIQNRERLEVCALQNGQNVVVEGTWHIKPEMLKSVKTLKKPHHTHFAAQMRELGLFDKANCGFYLSRKNDDKIMFYNEKTGVLDMLELKFEDNLEQMIEAIKLEDENGAKLSANFFAKFPDIDIKNIEFTHKNFASLWGAAGVMMGFGGDIKKAFDKLLDCAEIFGGEKGPRIDYKFSDDNALKREFNAHKLIRSVMSFKLAEVDDETLSFGVMESLAYFLSDFSDKLKGDFEIENVLLSGSLFASKRLSNLCLKHIAANHKIFFSKELPLEL